MPPTSIYVPPHGYGHPLWRFVGFVIDLCLSLAAGLVMSACALVLVPYGSGIPVVAAILTVVFYFPLFESSRLQATPGQVAVGIIVTDLQGKRITFWRALRRWGWRIVLLPLGWYALLSKRRQTLHDLMSDCLAIKKR